ncbi:sensor domain-containing phosphodiesterase [Salinisphaera sp. LB1]|uniref:sensor domain-containing phosphodiesterase n=1 Tax=Salinisphaera sp. LB1 TaxID=2183911 RepID=UPI000D708C98|nr:sensor domain-containing phosphodiesterase [Salinisphaera sp. LB1]AWN17381.1 diguanylate cyclase/phosphodiesterase (GGDEF & EAL domains) with PAS/PAC sensor(s) [Salinisphaera sp. LB1]
MTDPQNPKAALSSDSIADEKLRLAELAVLDILDTGPEERFDRVTRLAAKIFDVPTALISFIDHDRQWFKARLGLELCETARGNPFCRHTLNHALVFRVEDTAADPAFRDNSLVTGYPHIRFYAGRAIRGPTGQAVGALCIIDYKPRTFDDRAQDILIELGALVEAELMRRPDWPRGAGHSIGEPGRPDPTGVVGHHDLIHAHVDRLLAIAAKVNHRLAILHLRLDNLPEFKLVYDAGQTQRFINRWLEDLQDKNTDLIYIARLSEMALLGVLDLADRVDDIRRRCDALRAQAIQTADINDITFVFNTTAGVSLFPDHASSAQELINNARLAHARRRPGDTTALFTPLMAERSQRQSLLQERFMRAVVNDALHFCWQPIFGNFGRTLVGFELLARWYDPQLGAIGPEEFIPLIDQQERLKRALVVKAIDTACRQLARWQTRHSEPPHIAINIPGSEFYREDFPDLVSSILGDHGVAGNRLILELTERSLIPDFEATAQTMRRLRQTGIHIAIDDFGSGYSSIAYLTELPISSVKIDKSVVQQIDRAAQRYRLMQSIVDLAHGQNLPTVAEGVETPAQLQLVTDMRCEYTQGFLLGRPQPLKQTDALVDRSM